MTSTFLNQKIGYDTNTKVVKYAHENKISIKESILHFKLMSEDEFDEFFDYEKMISPKNI